MAVRAPRLIVPACAGSETDASDIAAVLCLFVFISVCCYWWCTSIVAGWCPVALHTQHQLIIFGFDQANSFFFLSHLRVFDKGHKNDTRQCGPRQRAHGL